MADRIYRLSDRPDTDQRRNRRHAIQVLEERRVDRHAPQGRRERGAVAVSMVPIRDAHRNRMPTTDLIVLLNAVLDVIGVPVTERDYAKALAAMESAVLETDGR